MPFVIFYKSLFLIFDFSSIFIILNSSGHFIDNKEIYRLLWIDFIKGDMISFRKIYADFYPLLYNFGSLYLDKEDIENAIQDLFLYILQRRKNIKKVENVKAYLITSYKHRIFKILKSKNVSLESLEPQIKIETQDNIWEDLLKKIINKLTPREKEIVELKYYQNYRNREIASCLNIEYQTVRNILHHAIQKMRLILTEVDPSYL